MASAQTLVAGRYRLQQQLGGGGMGLVWLARDEVLARDVAIKEVVPPAGLSETDRAELRFRTLREARTAARLNHPNVVKIYDVVHTEEWPWIVMEYVPSRSLHEVIAVDGPVSPARAARIGLSVLAALSAAHEAGVLHRDVKPGNVLIADDGRTVLTDFGLAIFDSDGAVTMPGLVLGSAQYVAPERARDGTSTPESDLWSLGATVYAAVEGRSPYARSSTMATLTALATALPDPPRRAGALKPVLSGLLRRHPKDRMTPDQVRRALQRVIDQAGTGRRRIPGQRRVREAAPVESGAVWRGEAATSPGTAEDPDGAPARPPWWAWRPAHRRRTWLAASLLVAVLLAGVGTMLMHSPHQVHSSRQVHSARQGVTPSAAPPSPATARPSPVPVLGTDACAAAGHPVPVASMPPRPGWDALLPGFVWYLDPSGFRISVPAGWLMTSGPHGVCFREPGNLRVLAIEPFTPDGDPISHWRRAETNLLAAGAPTGYTDLGITKVPYYFDGAAQWEYTFSDSSQTTQHGLDRCVIASPQHAYAVAWRTRQFDWQTSEDQYRAIMASFRPLG
ncbi:hypothetical protein GCM10023322_60300 [Rugosimonospora acidiphila]|uniref:non-specific serine/threonine protein kinase n=1 Tax=Rugosimonospora acidiphila TaxID=556531 RepID=A0ABP9SHN5_9ACTN